MINKRYVGFVILLLLISMTGMADKSKSALKALYKGEFEKVELILKKSMSKNSVDPGSKYIYSLLFTVDTFPRYNIDSAHYFVITAESDFAKLDEKEKLNLAKDEITEQHILLQRDVIDSLAFARARRIDDLNSYDYFITEYSSAEQYDSAIYYRNQTAFHIASKEASWQSYKSFIDKYPKASDLERATEEYNRLIFEEKTKSGGLRELEVFLKDHPNTPYKEILEKRIFKLLSEYGDAKNISYFISNYENDELKKYGMDILHHLHPTDPEFLELLNDNGWKNFKDSIESLTKVNLLPLIPLLDRGKYGFADQSDNVVIDFNYDQISTNYYCGNVNAQILEVHQEKSHLLINRLGTEVFNEDFDAFEELGNGLLKIKRGDRWALYHASSNMVLPFEYENFSVLNKQLLTVEKNGFVGINSVFGKEILIPEYDDIYLIDDYLIIEKEGLISLNLANDFTEISRNGKPELKFIYDDLEIIEKYIIGFVEDQEALLDRQLNSILPLNDQRINTKFETWVVQQSDGYKLFNPSSGELKTENYQQVVQNQNWLSVKRNGKWSVYSKSLSDVPIVGLDSVNLLGEDIALVFRNDKGLAIFPNKKLVEFSKNETLRTIGSGKITDVHFLVIERKDKNYLYKDGELLFNSFYEIGYISDKIFSVKLKSEYGATDEKGRLIMRIRYNAIGEADENGIAPVLYNGRFGAYNFKDKVLINLKFDERMKAYNDNLLIKNFRGEFGLHSSINENILDSQVEQIVYWTDSLALVKQEGTWGIMEIYTQEMIYDDILEFQYLSKDSSEFVIKVRSSQGLGICSSKKGMIIQPTFNEIINLGTKSEPVYFCEKAITEAAYYAVVYKDKDGKTMRTHAYREEEYENIVCDN